MPRNFRAILRSASQCKMESGPYRSRTDTPSRELDFESSASANSAKGPRLILVAVSAAFSCDSPRKVELFKSDDKDDNPSPCPTESIRVDIVVAVAVGSLCSG